MNLKKGGFTFMVLGLICVELSAKRLHSFAAEVRISSWSNGKWNSNAFVMRFPQPCTNLHAYGNALVPLYLGEDAGKCPVKPGFRNIKNQTFDLVIPQMPVLPYGRFLFHLLIYRDKEIAGLIVVDFDCLPRL